MFIKVICKNRESVFECSRYSMWDMQDNKVMIEIRGVDERDYEIHKDYNPEIYILNNQGKTIDTYRWN